MGAPGTAEFYFEHLQAYQAVSPSFSQSRLNSTVLGRVKFSMSVTFVPTNVNLGAKGHGSWIKIVPDILSAIFDKCICPAVFPTFSHVILG